MIQKLKNGHWPIFLLSSLSSFGNLFLPIILVRFLTPADVGVYKIFFLHLSAIPFLFMAGGPVNSVFYWSGKGNEERNNYLNATWTLSLIIAGLILLIGFTFRDSLSLHLDLPQQYVSLLIMTGAFYSPSGHFSESSIAAKKNIGPVLDTVFEILKAIGFIFIGWKFKNISFIFIFFSGYILLRVLICTYLNKRINNIGVTTTKFHLHKVWRYCSPIAFSGLLSFFVDKIDMLLLSAHLNASSFAFYSMGCLVVPPLYLLEMSVQKVLIPDLSKYYTEKNAEAGSEALRRAMKNISFLIIPSFFGLFLFARPIIRLLYTDQYLDSVIYLQIFAFSYLLLIFPHDSTARATGQTSWILKMYLIITPILLLSAYLSSVYLGAIGVLSVTLGIKFIPKFLGLRLAKITMGWKWREMFPLKHFILFLTVCFALSFFCKIFESSFQNDIHWFLICGPLFGIFYLMITISLGNRGKYAII